MEELVEAMDVEMEPVAEESKVNENCESNAILCEESNSELQEIQVEENRYENRAGTFTTGIDIFSKEEKVKMEERAKRFGLTDRMKNDLCNEEMELYNSMNISEESKTTRNVRLNVIHVRGTEDMSTKDVFKYFEDYAPASIEWINDVSCNVVWMDNVSATRAMLGLSKKILGLGERPSQKEPELESANLDIEKTLVNHDNVEMTTEDEINKETRNKPLDEYISIRDIHCPLPPGIWRKGVDYPKSKAIFMRFATRSDKKQQNAEKMSEYYKKHGNPNFRGIKGILTESRKKLLKQSKQTKRKLEEDPEDDGGDRKRMKNNPWGTLSETWGLNDAVEDVFVANVPVPQDQGRSVKDRLGTRIPRKEPIPIVEETKSTSESDSEDDWCKRNKVMRMRMHADDEEEKIHKRRVKAQRETLLTKLDRTNDLRSRLGRSKKDAQFREAIQVVVTNPSASRPNPKAESSEEEDGEIVDDESQEKEEGEWHASEEEHVEEEEEVEEEESEEESDEPVKEAQGPKGSVIKVVQHKPQVASTVWARLNNVQSDVIDSTVKDRQPRPRDLRDTLRGGDLRSRINNHTRGRSPLRIEVKNDKYMEDPSDTE